MKDREWFETWFDSPYYHILYQQHNEEEAEQFIDNLLNYFKLPQKASALDVACGKGRHAVYLAEKALDVTGIDLSWKNISYAQHFEHDYLSFFLHDMRNLFYINYFEAVFNLFTSFGYFESERENMRAVHSMSASLKKGGSLVIDFFNAKKIKGKLVPHQYVLRNGIMFLTKKNLEKRMLVKKIYFQDEGKEHAYEERVQMLELEDFEKYFEKNNLRVKEVFGNYQLNDFDENHSDRLIIIGEKI